jgi:hypothetical protein
MVIISYGPLINWLGFYWDDWPSIWYLHFFGPSSFKDSFATDRPVLGWLFMLTTSLMGESTIAWQLFGIFARWLSVVALWLVLRSLWPKHELQVTWIALLFAVYPGFSQQYISVTYSHAFFMLAVFFLSLGTMIWAIKKPNWFWPLMTISLVTSAWGIFTAEYYFGLELLRPVILWLILADKKLTTRERILQTGKYWLTYILIMVMFVIWRIFFFENPRGEIIIFDQLKESPLSTIYGLTQTIFQDIIEVSFGAWSNTISQFQLPPISKSINLVYFVIVIVSGVTCIFLFWKYGSLLSSDNKDDGSSTRRWALEAIFVGLYALFIAGWPIWVTDLHIELNFPWDRFTLPMMLGTSILVAGLLALLGKFRVISTILLGILVSLAVATHFQNGLSYHRDWVSQKSFFWEMVWRMPGIEPGTTILTSELPFDYFSDNSLTAPLNWTYAPDNTSRDMDYLLYDIEARLGISLSGFDKDIEIQQPYRATHFNGSTSKAVVIFYDPPRCLKIIDPIEDLTLPHKPRYIGEALYLSNPDLIITEANPYARPPEAIFGPEPEHNWCYYFQKAELAQQTGDWQQVAELGDQATIFDLVFTKENASELEPFIEGYAQVGQWDKAVKLSIKATQKSDKMI